MNQDKFSFTSAQRKNLLQCWKRQTDRSKAQKFIDDTERCINEWLPKTTEPRAGVAEQRKILQDMHEAALKILDTLNRMPRELGDFLNFLWIEKAYGGKYFVLHDETSHPSDSAQRLHDSAFDLAVPLTGALKTPRGRKLPPDFWELAASAKTWLEPLVLVTHDFDEYLRTAKKWQEKSREKNLLLPIARSYVTNFRKLPSPTNGSSFRRFAAELSKILEYDFGACIVKDCCEITEMIMITPDWWITD